MLVNSLERDGAREHILDAAERLFMLRGLAAVTLRDIGAELGLSHAALYYHFPGGKEVLFIEVLERNARRHGAGLAAAIALAGESLGPRLRAAAAWLLSQPPMDLIRMVQADLAALPPAEARRIMDLIYGLILIPLRDLFSAAIASGEIAPCDAGLVSGGVLGMVESLHSVPEFAVKGSRAGMAHELLEILLKGLDYREGGRT